MKNIKNDSEEVLFFFNDMDLSMDSIGLFDGDSLFEEENHDDPEKDKTNNDDKNADDLDINPDDIFRDDVSQESVGDKKSQEMEEDPEVEL